MILTIFPLAQLAPTWSLEQVLLMAGWTIWPLGGCLVVGLALIFANFWSLRADRLLQPKIVAQINAKIHSMDLDGARQLCGTYPSLITRVLRAGLDRVSHEYEASAVDSAMEAAAHEALARAAQPTHFLGLLAVAAPLFGLLGTVTGMLEAFAAMARPGGSPPEMLFAGLAESLTSTGLGVVVALFLFLAQGIFAVRLSTLTASVQRVAADTSAALGSAIRQAYTP